MSLSLIVCIGWIFALCIHEFCHAVVAYAGGDKSVKDKGYLTLNPIKYTDPGLTLVIPIIMLMLADLPGQRYIDRVGQQILALSSISSRPFGSNDFVYASPSSKFVNQNPTTPSTALALLAKSSAVLNSLPIPPSWPCRGTMVTAASSHESLRPIWHMDRLWSLVVCGTTECCIVDSSDANCAHAERARRNDSNWLSIILRAKILFDRHSNNHHDTEQKGQNKPTADSSERLSQSDR
jgi:hypothetical protein